MKSLRILAALLAAVVATSAFSQGKTVLGTLGQTTAATRIYAGPNTHSRVYYRAKPYEYLVLRPEKAGDYYKVMLQNGAYGYVPAEKVAELPYRVTEAKRTTRTDMTTYGSRSAMRGSGSVVTNYAMQFLGTPYKWGGNDPTRGIDCSGLVKNVFGHIGVNLPRTAAEQVHYGTPVTRLEDLQSGDRLYFWSAKRNCIGHTGIYMGGGYFVAASSGKGKVSTCFLGTKYWLSMLVAARR
jgi:cell wall-associated NlpC family hydrolase